MKQGTTERILQDGIGMEEKILMGKNRNPLGIEQTTKV